MRNKEHPSNIYFELTENYYENKKIEREKAEVDADKFLESKVWADLVTKAKEAAKAGKYAVQGDLFEFTSSRWSFKDAVQARIHPLMFNMTTVKYLSEDEDNIEFAEKNNGYVYLSWADEDAEDKVSIERVENGFLVSYPSNDLESLPNMREMIPFKGTGHTKDVSHYYTLLHLCYSVLGSFELYGSKHDKYRLDIRVVDQESGKEVDETGKEFPDELFE